MHRSKTVPLTRSPRRRVRAVSGVRRTRPEALLRAVHLCSGPKPGDQLAFARGEAAVALLGELPSGRAEFLIIAKRSQHAVGGQASIYHSWPPHRPGSMLGLQSLLG